MDQDKGLLDEQVWPPEKSAYTAQTALSNGWKKDLKYTWIVQAHQV